MSPEFSSAQARWRAEARSLVESMPLLTQDQQLTAYGPSVLVEDKGHLTSAD